MSGKADVDALVLAAGTSSRLGGADKLLAPLGEWPLILWSLRAFERAPSVARIVVTVSPQNRAAIETLVAEAGLSKPLPLVDGGPSRAHSVLNGLEALRPDGAVFVAVHDGARPFVTPELIERGASAVRRLGAVLAAVPAVDTIKLVDEKLGVAETPPRARVWLAHTPQFAKLDELLRAHRRQRAHLESFTDDASLLEAAGIRTYVFESAAENFKITTSQDLERAQLLADTRNRTRR